MTLVRMIVAQPVMPCAVELLTVGPQICRGTRVHAQFLQTTMFAAVGAWNPLPVRLP